MKYYVQIYRADVMAIVRAMRAECAIEAMQSVCVAAGVPLLGATMQIFGDVYVLYIALRKHVGLYLEPSRRNFPHRPWLQYHINTVDFVQHGVEIVHQTSLLPRAIHFVRVYQVL